jgi:hypothetical protein
MDRKLKGAIAVAIAVGLIAGAFPAVVSNPGLAKTAQGNVLVIPTNKGDRLPLKPISAASLPGGAKAQPPVGCDRAAKLAAIPAGESPANRDAMGRRRGYCIHRR